MMLLCPPPFLSPLQGGGFIATLAALAAGTWAANEYGYINLTQAKEGLQGLQASIPQLGVRRQQQQLTATQEDCLPAAG
jgi:hypothetical protein